MNTFEKILQTMSKNLGYTILLVASIIIFLYATDGDIVGGLLTAGAALVIYISGYLLYKEYKRAPVSATKTTSSAPAKKRNVAKKKTVAKKKK